MQSVGAVMTVEVSTVDADFPLLEGIGIMAKRAISCLVVREGSRPVGIMTERDLVRKLFPSGRDPARLRVADLMTSPVRTVGRETTTLEALQLLRKHAYRRLLVVDAAGALLGIVTQTDLLHSILADMEEATRVKSEIVSTVSHELRTPVALIAGYVELLSHGTYEPLKPRQQEVVGHLVRTSAQLVELVNAAVAVVQAQAGALSVVREPFDIARVLDQLGHDFEARVPAGVTLRWRNALDDRPVFADEAKIESILKNLVDNALKFTASGVVEVTADWADGMLMLSVRDTGIGIPSADVPRIFDMFRQVDGSSTRRFEGVGLGLYVVKRLVDAVGGTVEVDSTVGVGSTFRIAVPAARASV